MSGTFLDLYEDQIDRKLITPDAAQENVAQALADLEMRLSTYSPPQNGLLTILFGKTDQIDHAPKGLYLYGGVGRGKTMLMDMFYDFVSFEPKIRIHFNQFMSQAHELIAKYRKTHEGDPIPLVAQELADQAKLICFDEFYITDIADAMILGRLFAALFKEGVVFIATSNCPIDDLYKDGLNRDLFMPFISQLHERMVAHEVISPTDFRLRALKGKDLYFTPINQTTNEAVCSLWQAISGKAEGKTAHIIVKGRQLIVPEAANGTARFGFDDLCAQPLGRDDYQALASRYHTIFIDDIPVLHPSQRNEARRFVTLVDTLYDQGIRLIATAQAQPNELYKAGDNAVLFERTVSRLIEMRRAAHIDNTSSSTKTASRA